MSPCGDTAMRQERIWHIYQLWLLLVFRNFFYGWPWIWIWICFILTDIQTADSVIDIFILLYIEFGVGTSKKQQNMQKIKKYTSCQIQSAVELH